ncbi:DUF7289 family protein [Halobellus ordinarius]|uniref:DUF7289 family protein n=1 Tax=Halobellus ordinarius TaxID=3075120 RepID=UPI0028805C48|nr:hypothetical protein [Halobellus sp. ZY16]
MRRDGDGGWRTPARTDRAVSETISFVLVFSLIVASVGAVYAIGVSELEATRDAERIENAQRAFDVLADNVDDVLEGAPSRGTEVKLAEATLRSADDASMNVTVDPAGGGTPRNWEFSLSPLVYNIEAGGEIRLSNGAVLRDSAGGGAAMIRGPPVVVDDDHIQLTLIRQEHSGPVAVGGSQTVRIRTAASRSRLFYDDAGGHDLVRVNVTTPYPDAWGRHYESVGFDCSVVDAATPGSSGTVSCNATDVDRVTIVWSRVRTSFE